MKINTTRRYAVAAAMVLAAGAAWAFGVECPIDHFSAYFTGETKIDSATGKLLQLYKCANGHEFWVVPG